MKNNFRSRVGIHKFLFVVLLLLPASLLAEPITLKHAVELALQHANGAAIAAAEQQNADANSRQLRYNYLPQVTAGSGLGWSYGFPLTLGGSAPSIFNIAGQSALIHPELRSFIRAAKTETAAAGLHTKDERNQVIQDTVLSYAELEKWEHRLDRLHEIYPDVQQMQAAVGERVKEGIDSELDGTRARLSEARLRLRIAEAQGSADVLREHLSKLTGLPARGIQTENDSLPAFPASLPMTTLPSKPPNRAPPFNPLSNMHEHNICAPKASTAHSCPRLISARSMLCFSTFNNYQNYYIPRTALHCKHGNFSVSGIHVSKK